ncbi:hypothetical protein GIB67_006365 [Kingdonia uniflora]|uniref:Uncharacterized protein n=1 Tax=Kingdonia uniflora TaxID=39325 RepID=A0A7J7P0L6_9MAGN|nr:hypothetical protein GIB67_006365 [Kingdonia uniflora]
MGSLLFTKFVVVISMLLVSVRAGCPFTAIYGFGDSSSVGDHLASAFHLPSPKPYLQKDKAYGVNFAAPGATALNSSFFETREIKLSSNNNTLDGQIEQFMTYLDTICSSHHGCVKKLKHAVFLVGEFGANDYSNALFQGKHLEEVDYYVTPVVKSIKDAVKNLIEAGAVNLVVPGILPLGCLPSYLTMFHHDDPMSYDSKKCLRSFNTFAMLHNDHLQQALADLRVEYPHVQIVYASYYKAFTALLHNHDLLGFEKGSLTKACCGTGGLYNFDATKMCGSEGVPVCSDPTKYVHWDGNHLTEEAYIHMVEGFISGNFVYPKLKLRDRRLCIM